MREPAVGNTIAVAIAIGCTFVIGGCATATGGDTESTATASEEYLFKEPLKSGCVKQRRTGTRIPRCSRDAGIYSKAYHAPGREVDDRAN